MSKLAIKIVSKSYNKLLSRAELYFKKVRLDEKYYFLENYMFITLLPLIIKLHHVNKPTMDFY